MVKKHLRAVPIPKQNPCFTERVKKKDRKVEHCQGATKSPFSWWCNPLKRGGYQFLEENESFSGGRYRDAPWQPIVEEKKDDTWPYNCDPLRSATSNIPRCLNKLICGDNVCFRKFCKKYKLKAPLYHLPKILGELPHEPCRCPRVYKRKKRSPFLCKIHPGTCNCEVVNISNSLGSTPSNKRSNDTFHQKEPLCSVSFAHSSVTNIKSCSKAPVCYSTNYVRDIASRKKLFTEVLEEINDRKIKKGKSHIEVSLSYPTKSKYGNEPNCQIKGFFKNYRSCGELPNKNVKEEAKSGSLLSNPYLRYLRCFELEKDTLEYIKKCLCKSEKKREPPNPVKNSNSSTQVLFHKLLDEKFDKIASMLEISKDLQETTSKNGLFALLTNQEFLENLDEDVRARYKSLFSEKLENLNRALLMIQRVGTTKDEAELLEFLQQEGINLKASLDETILELNRKLFINKLNRINSIIELTEKMKVSMKANDFETLFSNEVIQKEAEREKREFCKEKKNVDMIFERENVITIESSEVIAYSSQSCRLGLSVSATDTDQKGTEENHKYEGKVEENRETSSKLYSETTKSNFGSINLKMCKNVVVDEGITDAESKPVASGSRADERYSFYCQPMKYYHCPSSFFEIDTYLKGLKALLTTYDPFLSPFSPMRDKILARKLYRPKKMVSAKKCFPLSLCNCLSYREKPCRVSPICSAKQGRPKILCHQPYIPRNEERRMCYCTHCPLEEPCLCGIHP